MREGGSMDCFIPSYSYYYLIRLVELGELCCDLAERVEST